jgi:hypothetical protein
VLRCRRQPPGKSFEQHGARIDHPVLAVAHAHDFLALGEAAIDELDRALRSADPVGRLQRRLVGTAVQHAVQSAEGRGQGVLHRRQGARHHPGGEGAGVEAVLDLQDLGDLEGPVGIRRLGASICGEKLRDGIVGAIAPHRPALQMGGDQRRESWLRRRSPGRPRRSRRRRRSSSSGVSPCSTCMGCTSPAAPAAAPLPGGQLGMGGQAGAEAGLEAAERTSAATSANGRSISSAMSCPR